MPTHNGKIGKLPPHLQEKLNNRLLTNESSTTILRWLNDLPQVVALLRDHFESSPVSPQNLSEWRRGGYLQWLIQSKNVVRQRLEGGSLETEPPEPYNGPCDDDAVIEAESQLRREPNAERDPQQEHAKRQERAAQHARRDGRPTSSDDFHDQLDSLYEDAAELGDNGIRAKDLLHVITARYAELLQDWGKIPENDFDHRMRTLQKLTKNIAVVRRLEQNDERLEFLREKERNKSKSRSASSRPVRTSGSPSAPKPAESQTENPSKTTDSAAEGSSGLQSDGAGAQTPSPAPEGAAKCGAVSQPAPATSVKDNTSIHRSALSSTPATPSTPSTPSNKNPAPNAHPAAEANVTPSVSVSASSEPSQPIRILPTNYSQFPPNSQDRRSRFGLL